MNEPRPCWLCDRQAGCLLHVTSLPSADGQGHLGPIAYRFIDYLADAGFTVWQMLPVSPVHADLSPYLPRSTFAGHTGLISAELLARQGLIDGFEADGSDLPERRDLVGRAWQAFQHAAGAEEHSRFERFQEAQAAWLPDYTLFRSLALEHEDRAWFHWPRPERNIAEGTLSRLRERHAASMEREAFGQYLFFEQWRALAEHAHARGIRLFGDLPIYVAQDSADVWRWRENFMADEEGELLEVAGVPPDAFSATGQRWGNPLYDWEYLRRNDYRWWIHRFQNQTGLFDILRVDHFRGFESYWSIPGDSDTAETGRWRPGPGQHLFDAVFKELGPLPLVAEDLGEITPQVDALRSQNGFPGMRVLQFAFEGDAENPHRLANHEPDSVVYTGTHDNDTTLGWWESQPDKVRRLVLEQLDDSGLPMPRLLARAALNSVGRLAVLPMQDLLGLGSEARMNTPGTAQGNWTWQMPDGVIDAGPASWIRAMIESSGRLPEPE